MMRKVCAALVLAVVTLGAGSALAQTRRSDDCAEQRKRDPKKQCHLDMPNEEVKGNEVPGPGTPSVARPYDEGGSLIRVRTDMTDKIVATAERL